MHRTHVWISAVVTVAVHAGALSCSSSGAETGEPNPAQPWDAASEELVEASPEAQAPDSGADVADAAQDAGADAGQPPWNEGWIGAACGAASDCAYAEATCMPEYPQGMCSMPCEATCPDPDDALHAATFCIEDPLAAGEGICVARCDFGWLEPSGCREGMACKWRERVGQSWVVEDVCVADDGAAACVGDEVRQPNVGIEEPAGLGGCPAGMAPIAGGGVCIDRWEAYLVEVKGSGAEAPWSPYFNPGDRTLRAASAPGAVPQGYVSGDQAAAACAQAGKRLCTRDEWELACRGPEGNTYPYGATREPGVCNDHRDEHPAEEYFGTTDSWIWSELGHACLNQLPSSLDRAGQRAACVTADGVFDLMGNLHEWIDDPAGTFKGGFYVDTVLNGEGCLYTTTAHDTSYWDYSTGFRCCADK